MLGDLGKSQLSSLLETVPGLASVLRSPVADAIVNMIRAGAGLRDFDIDDAKELVQYATRRGLIPSAEGALLLDEVKGIGAKSKAKPRNTKKTSRAIPKPAGKAAKKKVSKVKTKVARKTAAVKTAAVKTAKKKAVPKKPAGKAKKKGRR